MGQRHQYIVVFPEMNLGEGNVNNKPARACIIHHQWLYGRTAIITLSRVLTFVKNYFKESNTDYMFGTDSRGYAGGDAPNAIAACMSIDPSEGYFHSVHMVEEDIEPSKIDPNMLDNNDGCTLVVFEKGSKKPKIAFLTPGHVEGNHWDAEKHGTGPWIPETYLSFYYDKKEQKEWDQDLKNAMAGHFANIEKQAKLLTKEEVKKLLPKFKGFK